MITKIGRAKSRKFSEFDRFRMCDLNFGVNILVKKSRKFSNEETQEKRKQKVLRASIFDISLISICCVLCNFVSVV